MLLHYFWYLLSIILLDPLPEIHILCISEWCVTECHIIVSIIWQAGLRWALKTGYLANITIQFQTFTVIIAIILRIQMVCKHSAARRQQRTEKIRKVKKKERKRKGERRQKRSKMIIFSIERAHLQLIGENSQRILHSIFLGLTMQFTVYIKCKGLDDIHRVVRNIS